MTERPLEAIVLEDQTTPAALFILRPPPVFGTCVTVAGVNRETGEQIALAMNKKDLGILLDTCHDLVSPSSKQDFYVVRMFEERNTLRELSLVRKAKQVVMKFRKGDEQLTLTVVRGLFDDMVMTLKEHYRARSV